MTLCVCVFVCLCVSITLVYCGSTPKRFLCFGVMVTTRDGYFVLDGYGKGDPRGGVSDLEIIPLSLLASPRSTIAAVVELLFQSVGRGGAKRNSAST